MKRGFRLIHSWYVIFATVSAKKSSFPVYVVRESIRKLNWKYYRSVDRVNYVQLMFQFRLRLIVIGAPRLGQWKAIKKQLKAIELI